MFNAQLAPEITHASSYGYGGPHMVFAAGTDIKWRVESTSTAVVAYAEFNGYLVEAP